jgi:hypothetical protein
VPATDDHDIEGIARNLNLERHLEPPARDFPAANHTELGCRNATRSLMARQLRDEQAGYWFY